ncbi:MAG: hypothetical protein KAJ19_27640 [Gammaproteobacteria bacterium]|nr:hypothetical protein [Gammaproteobacteria bacterium]
MPLRIKVKRSSRRSPFQSMARDLGEEIAGPVNSQIGMLVAGTASKKVQQGGRSGKTYTRRGVTHQASAPGEAPKTDTGTLVSSIFFKKKGFAVQVIANTPSAARLEYGPRGDPGAARPFLRPAVAENRKKIIALYTKAARKTGRKNVR